MAPGLDWSQTHAMRTKPGSLLGIIQSFHRIFFLRLHQMLSASFLNMEVGLPGWNINVFHIHVGGSMEMTRKIESVSVPLKTSRYQIFSKALVCLFSCLPLYLSGGLTDFDGKFKHTRATVWTNPI